MGFVALALALGLAPALVLALALVLATGLALALDIGASHLCCCNAARMAHNSSFVCFRHKWLERT